MLNVFFLSFSQLILGIFHEFELFYKYNSLACIHTCYVWQFILGCHLKNNCFSVNLVNYSKLTVVLKPPLKNIYTYKTLVVLFDCLLDCLRPCVQILDTEWLILFIIIYLI